MDFLGVADDGTNRYRIRVRQDVRRRQWRYLIHHRERVYDRWDQFRQLERDLSYSYSYIKTVVTSMTFVSLVRTSYIVSRPAMMLSTYQRVCLLWLGLAPLSSSESFGYYKVDGRTRLLGSSFGVLGINSTFDYVVHPATMSSSSSSSPFSNVAAFNAVLGRWRGHVGADGCGAARGRSRRLRRCHRGWGVL